ncbi:hypothetical protein, partial [Bacillus cereus group sp. BfR-BA-01315]|uniref:hypothetical protein n=1 Tax=Bacillus cereus group sp. BfR-BA-01315 TaxID=2920292 RepID=UPI001F571A31
SFSMILYIFLYIPILVRLLAARWFPMSPYFLYKILHALSLFFFEMLAVPHRYQAKLIQR